MGLRKIFVFSYESILRGWTSNIRSGEGTIERFVVTGLMTPFMVDMFSLSRCFFDWILFVQLTFLFPKF